MFISAGMKRQNQVAHPSLPTQILRGWHRAFRRVELVRVWRVHWTRMATNAQYRWYLLDSWSDGIVSAFATSDTLWIFFLTCA